MRTGVRDAAGLLTLTLECLRSDLTVAGIAPVLRTGLGLEPVPFAPLRHHPWVHPLGKDRPGLPAWRIGPGQPHHSGPALGKPLQRGEAAATPR